MRKCKKSFISVCMALAIALFIPSVNVYAADTYTVTFRPGNVGYFATAANPNPEGYEKEMAERVAELTYSGSPKYSSYVVTDNGAIKITVKAGTPVPQAPTYIQAKEGYFVKEVSSWGPSGEKVFKNVDYVVDYGKLVNGVEYTVEYVDSASGESIAPIYIAQDIIGERRSVTAPAQIVISGSTVYNLTSAATMELVLDEDATKNVFTFYYTMAPRGTTTEEVVIGADGQIITTTDYVTTTVGGAQAAGATVVTAGGAAGGGAAAGDAAEAGQEAGGAVEIADEETPLAGTAGDTEEAADAVEITEEEVPLAGGEEPLANMAMIGASLFATAAVVLAGMWLFMKKRRATAQNDSNED